MLLGIISENIYHFYIYICEVGTIFTRSDGLLAPRTKYILYCEPATCRTRDAFCAGIPAGAATTTQRWQRPSSSHEFNIRKQIKNPEEEEARTTYVATLPKGKRGANSKYGGGPTRSTDREARQHANTQIFPCVCRRDLFSAADVKSSSNERIRWSNSE